MPDWTRWWLLGAITGIGLLLVMVSYWLAFPLVVAALVVLALRSPDRAAFAGGALVPTGLWFLYELREAVERCAAIDRSPNGSCSIYGVEDQAIAMALYVAVGLGLTTFAAFRRRPPSPGEGDRSAAVPRRR